TNLFSHLFYKADLATLGPKALLLATAQDLAEMRRSLQGYRPLLQQVAQATNFNSLFSLINRQFRTASSKPNAGIESLVHGVRFLQHLVAEATQSVALPGTPPAPAVEVLFGGGEQAEQRSYLTF